MPSRLVAIVLLALTSSALADSIAMPVPAKRAGAPVLPALESYVFIADPYQSGRPPTGLAANKVGAYLAVMIDKATPLRAVEYAATAALFYDASEVVAPYLALLDKTERTPEDVQRSIIFARLAAQLGTDKDAAAAATYFVYLCGRADSQAELVDLVGLYAALSTSVDPRPLRDRITARLATLAPKIKTDDQARFESLKLQESVSTGIDRVAYAKQAQAKILTNPDRKARLRALIEHYIGIEADATDLVAWAAARLRRETWAEQPAEHLVRVAKPAHATSVIKALRDALPAIEKHDADEREFMRLRVLRAIAFFGGTLSATEKKWVAAKANAQRDLLTR